MNNKEIRRRNTLALIKNVGGNKAFAEKIGLAEVGYVSHIRTGFRGIGHATARKIENAFEKPEGWLDTPKWLFEDTASLESVLTNTRPLPLISWVQAGEWTEIQDGLEPNQAEEWLPCPINHGPNAYILRVKGISMENLGARPSFSEGDLIFVDPDKSPEHRSLVVVRLDDDPEATFKQLLIEGPKRYLRALNPAWPTPVVEINGNTTMCGVVIFKGEKI